MEQRSQLGPYIAAGCVALALGIAVFGFVVGKAVRVAGEYIGNGAAVAGGNISSGIRATDPGRPVSQPTAPKYLFVEAPRSLVEGMGHAGYWRINQEAGVMELFVYTQGDGGRWVEVKQIQLVQMQSN